MTTRTVSLLVDAGNTTTKIGLADAAGLFTSYVLPTDKAATPDSLGLALTSLAAHAGVAAGEVSSITVSSVVPPMDPLLSRAAERYFGVTARFVPRDVAVPLENRYARPHEVGADRLVTAYAGRLAAETPVVVVVDFGTATTFDCVKGNAFLGGLICPGLFSSLKALSLDTAKLPHIALDHGHGGLSIGQSTSECLNQGFLHGFAAMAEGVGKLLVKHLGEPATILATGGFAARLAPLCPSFSQVRPDLLLEGLLLLSRQGVVPEKDE
ncbi:type III pantothenate kinase [Desulfolutivibrio sulfoxidireducens]|uniref:type III pantothenate kinase n=1 Tax=Desulfolutivibrio sulfoxidireducens TaxID=2773299 RepID=UPI00159D3494|nr:type III pantothenate kinase [Desulfolutivibrio sulfoxidireducens]QLA16599.1 type III pantothenate kinase [Desulfolutivibrio sulfoxidireducens]QLA19519.1 type III pantothenate kinase [Desulfolutivibrio sulfoxidireducens]